MSELFLDAFLDSLKVFGFTILIYILLSFVENKIALLFQKHAKATPLLGAGCGLIPQCGISVVAADLYHKEHITVGTLLAIFFACSDEALPILMISNKSLYTIPLLILKFIFGFILGYCVDLVIRKKELKAVEQEIHIGCCHHEIEHEEESFFHEHFFHPLIHSFKIFIYVFLLNIIFGLLIYWIGEESLYHFLDTNMYLGPFFASLLGLIPNCASSVVLTELFINNGLSFGALMTGLCLNSGLGFIYLMKFKEERIKAFKALLILYSYSLLLGYLLLGMMNWLQLG